MQACSPDRAFGIAQPRRPAVLCLPGPDGSTDLITVQWFNWLNLRRNPMVTYAMETTASLGLNVQDDSTVYLAFPSVEEAVKYKSGIRTAYAGKTKALSAGIEPVSIPEVPVLVPSGTEAVLRCEIAGSYKYPFKKVRIYNCNLVEAFCATDGDSRKKALATLKGESAGDSLLNST